MKPLKDLQEIGNSLSPVGKTWRTSPTGRSALIIQRALHHISSVSYAVSTRWVFYRLLDEGTLTSKDDYSKFKGVMSKARHGGYVPLGALSDAGRSPIRLSGYFDTIQDWLPWHMDQLRDTYAVDLLSGIDPKVFVAYEALAMSEQFRVLCQDYGVVLYGCGGDPSIAFKYEMAMEVKTTPQPSVFLFFSDADPKGKMIAESSMRDVKVWSGRDDFKAYHAGLTEIQSKEFGMTTPAQWESLSDSQARQVVASALDQFIDVEEVKQSRLDEKTELGRIADVLEELV